MQRNVKHQQQKFPIMRLFRRQYLWMPTTLGWGVIIAVFAVMTSLTVMHIHPFLAINSPLQQADVLVVEGWIPDYALKQAATEYQKKSYSQIITTGVPLEKGSYLLEYKNYAEIAALTLKNIGLESEKIVAVSSPEVKKDRTYASAIALHQWLEKSNSQITAINLFTHDTHARRSWLIFQKALAPKIQVGIISSTPQNYEPNKWWIYSAGVRSIINEIVAYVYAVVVSWKG
ncbi:ElyC/SanA/YdcF family protein [Fischerella sp. JS2]|uniref:ElyC/SanA/YdcF family protein n=1 Tax=Fischerella sp. JS2 TaxID=2597771 RepID=UPI0028EA2F32|nr:ElyC/SanA/YdcF family protein [Fischerella sp. JS2]